MVFDVFNYFFNGFINGNGNRVIGCFQGIKLGFEKFMGHKMMGSVLKPLKDQLITAFEVKPIDLQPL